MMETMETKSTAGLAKTLRTALMEGEMKIVFRKLDGSLRTMLCTLDPTLIPSDKLPSNTTNEPVDESPEYMRVYDLQAKGWRSFRLANIIEPENVLLN